MNLNKILEVSAAIVLPNLGLIGAYLSYKSSEEAFHNRMAHMKLSEKAFLPLFCGLQSVAGYGSYLMWKIGNDLSLATKTGIPLLLYGSQMLLNWAWPAVFQKSLKWVCYKEDELH